jgi:hypothetical protein
LNNPENNVKPPLKNPNAVVANPKDVKKAFHAAMQKIKKAKR